MAYRSSRKTYLTLGLVLSLIIGTHYLGWLKPVEKLLRLSLIPFVQNAHTISIKTKNNYHFFNNKESFFKAYEQCVSDSEQLAVVTSELKLLASENSELRKQLNFEKKQSFPLIVSDVVGKEIFGSDESIIINKGSLDGIKIDQPVVVGEGTLVGKISKVEKDSSIVRLLNDNQSKVAATILNHDHSLGVVEGWYTLSLEMNLIPRNEIILVGDQVVTSGLEPAIPRGLLIGTVAVVENEPYKSFQHAILTSNADLSKLTIVSVLRTN